MTEENTPITPADEGSAKPAGKAIIEFDDFMKLDLRVGKVVEVAEHPNADRLLVLQVDMGSETRQLVAGIKAYYAPEALLGREIIVVANLAPRKMRGVESQGMLLAAATDEEKSDVVILTTEKPVPPGASCS
ncbi:MAG: methionine--tRNA ligase subunit beta [Phycisphaerae bacterium]|nr:methionine--tRNA ligase subunit beta [Phycisphaerae bacterium]